jgi:hypothetical protein
MTGLETLAIIAALTLAGGAGGAIAGAVKDEWDPGTAAMLGATGMMSAAGLGTGLYGAFAPMFATGTAAAATPAVPVAAAATPAAATPAAATPAAATPAAAAGLPTAVPAAGLPTAGAPAAGLPTSGLSGGLPGGMSGGMSGGAEGGLNALTLSQGLNNPMQGAMAAFEQAAPGMIQNAAQTGGQQAVANLPSSTGSQFASAGRALRGAGSLMNTGSSLANPGGGTPQMPPPNFGATTGNSDLVKRDNRELKSSAAFSTVPEILPQKSVLSGSMGSGLARMPAISGMMPEEIAGLMSGLGRTRRILGV